MGNNVIQNNVRFSREQLKEIAEEYLFSHKEPTIPTQKDVKEWWDKNRNTRNARGFDKFYSIVRKETRKMKRQRDREETMEHYHNE